MNTSSTVRHCGHREERERETNDLFDDDFAENEEARE